MVVMILVVCILGIGVIFLIYTRSRIEQRSVRAGTPRERIEEIKDRAAAEGELNTSMAELLELSRRLAAQLENRAERIEQLIQQADARIEALGGLATKKRFAAGSPPANGVLPLANDAPDDRLSLEREKLEHLSRDDRAARDVHEEIHRLADQGFSSVEIAQRLDEHTGKVELVLALRKK